MMCIYEYLNDLNLCSKNAYQFAISVGKEPHKHIKAHSNIQMWCVDLTLSFLCMFYFVWIVSSIFFCCTSYSSKWHCTFINAILFFAVDVDKYCTITLNNEFGCCCCCWHSVLLFFSVEKEEKKKQQQQIWEL